MKNLFVLWFLLCFTGMNLLAQDASAYFPAAPGYTWHYKVTQLDSANNENQSVAYYRIDSFAVEKNYKGKHANFILSKVSLSPGTPYIPLPDTAFISLEGSDAHIYYKLNIDSLISSFSSSKILSKNLYVNEEGEWLSFYKFAQTENQPHQILTLDTTVNYKGLPLQGRFEVIGIRVTDQTVQTDAGDFNCKKFVVNYNVSIKLLGSYSKLFTISDTVWFALDQWIVQDIMPSIITNPLGLGQIFIPGSKKILITRIPTGIVENNTKINDFKLYQNYPNPFNPGTIIKYSLSKNSFVTLKIYDILGNEIADLVNREQSAGDYQIEYVPSRLNAGFSSGVYFYRLKTGTASITKKLVYVK